VGSSLHWEVADPASTPMSPILPKTITFPSALSVSPLVHELDLRDEALSDISFSSSPLDATSTTSTTSTYFANVLAPAAIPTRPVEINEKDSGYEYVTLTVTSPYTTYITTILLGDSFPTTNVESLQPTTYAVPSSSSNTKVQTPGIATGTIVGIVVGLIFGFLSLFGVFYVYLLRARQAKRRRQRRRSRRGSSATADGE
jgi:hypothetical protein